MGEQIIRKPSAEELLRERAQAFEAETRKQERRIAEQEREFGSSTRPAQQKPPAATFQQPKDDWQTRKDRDNARTSASSITNDGGRWDAKAEAARKEEARRRAAQQPPTIITNCNAGFCYDDKGGVYHKAGPDFMTGPNGKACHRAGPSWICH